MYLNKYIELADKVNICLSCSQLVMQLYLIPYASNMYVISFSPTQNMFRSSHEDTKSYVFIVYLIRANYLM